MLGYPLFLFSGLKSFTVSPSVGHVKLGASATFTCVAAIAPNPFVEMFFNRKTIHAGGIAGNQTSPDEVWVTDYIFRLLVSKPEKSNIKISLLGFKSTLGWHDSEIKFYFVITNEIKKGIY